MPDVGAGGGGGKANLGPREGDGGVGADGGAGCRAGIRVQAARDVHREDGAGGGGAVNPVDGGLDGVGGGALRADAQERVDDDGVAGGDGGVGPGALQPGVGGGEYDGLQAHGPHVLPGLGGIAAEVGRHAGHQHRHVQAVDLKAACGNEAIAAVVAGAAEDDGLADAGTCGDGLGLAGNGCARTAHGGVAGQVSLGEGQGFGLTNARDGNPLHKRSLCPSL